MDRAKLMKALPYVAGALLLVAIGVIIALVTSGGGDGKSETVTVTPAQTTVAPPTTTTTTTTTVAPLTTTTATTDTTAYQNSITAVDTELGSVGPLPKAKDFGNAQFTQDALNAAKETGQVAQKVGAVTPPPQVASQHEQLIGQIRAVQGAFKALATANENDDRTGAIRALQRAHRGLRKARNEIGIILQALNQ